VSVGIQSLKGSIAKDIWSSKRSKRLPQEHWKRARMLLEIMNASSKLENLKLMGSSPDVRLHKLSGDRKGQWSVTIHKLIGWRIVFSFEDGEFLNVEIVDYHGG
jgi:proteic killer suppression protein